MDMNEYDEHSVNMTTTFRPKQVEKHVLRSIYSIAFRSQLKVSLI